MDKFTDVNLIDTFNAIIQTNIPYHQNLSGSEIDTLYQAAQSNDSLQKTVLLLCYPDGVVCSTEREVFQRETQGYENWKFYHKSTDGRVLAYAADIKSVGTTTDNIMGDLYELDYHKHAVHISETAVASTDVTLRSQTGEEIRMSRDEYYTRIIDHTHLRYFRSEPDNPVELVNILLQERNNREKSGALCDFNDHKKRLLDGHIPFEAKRITAALQKLEKPNSPSKTHFMAALSPSVPHFIQLKDFKKLSAAIPYKNLIITSFRGYKKLYAMVEKNEILQERSSKPSLIEHLQETKKAVKQRKETQKTAPKRGKEMEV